MPPWSFSSLNNYITCPNQYEALKVSKRFRQEETEHTRWGTEVHEAIERFIKNGEALPQRMEKFSEYVNSLCTGAGDTYVELQLAIDDDLQPTEFLAPNVWTRGIVDFLRIKKRKGLAIDHKGLPLTTELPTPTGFTTMGDVKVGDKLFDIDGKICEVVQKSEVHNRACYKVTFDDTSTVVCDDEHLWLTVKNGVIPVTKLEGKCITVPSPIQLPEKSLVLDPYILGIWLADGKHTSGEICKPDAFIWEEIRRRGYDFNGESKSGPNRCKSHTVFGIRDQLRQLRVLGNKHIPNMYLRASFEQRLDLLNGLMDGDGYANNIRNQAVFCTTDKEMSDQVMELLYSLGQRPYQSTAKATGFGIVTIAYNIYFRPLHGINPFSMPRKAAVMDSVGEGLSWRRKVEKIESVESAPTQCIAVNSPTRTYLCTRKFIPTHNTGKRKDGSRQLKQNAGLIFAHFEELDELTTGYGWLQEGGKIGGVERFTRADISKIWKAFDDDLKRMAWSFEHNAWPKNKSGLCGKWCCVTDCEHNGRYKR